MMCLAEVAGFEPAITVLETVALGRAKLHPRKTQLHQRQKSAANFVEGKPRFMTEPLL